MRGSENDELAEKGYAPYLTNKSLSYFTDTLLYANEMNMHPEIDKRLQYDFYIHIVRPRKRFSPWLKKEQIDDLDLVKKHYGYSNEKAKVAVTLLTKTQLETIRNQHDMGGKQ